MAILDLIEFLDPTGRQIVHRVPEGGSGQFRLGSQLVVRESQVAGTSSATVRRSTYWGRAGTSSTGTFRFLPTFLVASRSEASHPSVPR